jgi:UDP-2-acetamido-2-deoxy-ribo-hexuluronate aminotransferase
MHFIDLAAQQNLIRDKIEANIQAVLAHGKYIMGPEIKELEKRLAEFVGVEHPMVWDRAMLFLPRPSLS